MSRDLSNYTVGQIMNNIHIVAKEHDEGTPLDELSSKERLKKEESLVMALAEVTDYSPVEINDMLDDFFDELEITEEESERLESEGIPKDQQVGTVVADGKAEIDTGELADLISEKLFGDTE